MPPQTLKIQHVVDTVKTWSLPEQLELIQAIAKLSQGLYTFNGNDQVQVTKSIATVEHETWLQLSQAGLNNAYSTDEPEYTLDMLQEPNPAYEAR
jgi:hypothetical protein